MSSWTEPTIDWQAEVDSRARHGELHRDGEVLSSWPPAAFENTPTDCFRVGDAYWIWQTEVGGISFFADRPEVAAFPDSAVRRSWFEHLIRRSWLPAVYQLWGRQVLHASAVASTETGAVGAFVGPSGAGKSTLAFGLGTRPAWQQVSDDTLAFSADSGAISLHPLPNETRLRPTAAGHFRRNQTQLDRVRWPATPLALSRIYFLHADEDVSESVRIVPLRPAASYVQLLEQAHALTLAIPDHNKRLMRDYLTLAMAVPAFRVEFRKSFDVFSGVCDVVDQDLSRAEMPRHSAVPVRT